MLRTKAATSAGNIVTRRPSTDSTKATSTNTKTQRNIQMRFLEPCLLDKKQNHIMGKHTRAKTPPHPTQKAILFLANTILIGPISGKSYYDRFPPAFEESGLHHISTSLCYFVNIERGPRKAQEKHWKPK